MFRLKLALRSAVVMTIVGGILFGSAGRTDLPFFWAYLAVCAGLMIVTMLTVSRELQAEHEASAAHDRTGRAEWGHLPVLELRFAA